MGPLNSPICGTVTEALVSRTKKNRQFAYGDPRNRTEHPHHRPKHVFLDIRAHNNHGVVRYYLQATNTRHAITTFLAENKVKTTTSTTPAGLHLSQFRADFDYCAFCGPLSSPTEKTPSLGSALPRPQEEKIHGFGIPIRTGRIWVLRPPSTSIPPLLRARGSSSSPFPPPGVR